MVAAESEIRGLLNKATETETETFFKGRLGQLAIQLGDNLYALVEKIDEPVKYDFKVTDVISYEGFSVWRRNNNAKAAGKPTPQHAARPGGRILLAWGEEEIECSEEELDDEIKRLTEEGIGLGDIRVWQEVKLSISVVRAQSATG
jgi:hypothetical protein